MKLSIHVHPATAAAVMADAVHGPRHLGIAVREALQTSIQHGRRVAYAPLLIAGEFACAMSVHTTFHGVVVEIDAPGTRLPHRDVVKERNRPQPPKRRPY